VCRRHTRLRVAVPVRRVLSLVLAALLAIGVAAAIVASVRDRVAADDPPLLTTVRGVIGSEKQPFFRDPAVAAVFARHGLQVQVDTAGSRELATRVDLDRYDFAFPAGIPAAERIRRERKVTAFYQPFYTPMAVGTFKPIAKLLAKAGVASPLADGYWRFDMRRYLDLVARKTRWNELPGNTVYPARKCRRERQQPPADPPAPHVPARRQHQEKLVRALPIAPHGERARTRRVRRGEGGELLRLQTHAGTLPTPDLHRWTLLARLRLAHASCVYRRLQRGHERCRHGQRGTTGTGVFARPAAPPRDRPCSWPAARTGSPLGQDHRHRGPRRRVRAQARRLLAEPWVELTVKGLPAGP
jgi:hypothetical protein